MTARWKIKTLGKLLFRLETRNSDGSSKKLVYLLMTYLLPGMFISFLILKQTQDKTGFQFAFVNYLLFSILILFTLTTEFDNLLMSAAESDVLTNLPLTGNMIARAKTDYVFPRYLFFLTLPLLLPSSVYFYLIVKSAALAIVYYLHGYLICLFFASIVLLLYSIIIKNLSIKKTSYYTLFFQVILIFILIFGYQYISYFLTGKASMDEYFKILENKKSLFYFPYTWFAFVPSVHNNPFSFKYILKMVLPLATSYLAYLSLKLYLVDNMNYIIEKYNLSRTFTKKNHSKPSFISVLVYNNYLRNKDERSSFNLMQNLFKNDKSVRVNIIPLLIIPAALLLFALITGQLPSPIGKNYFTLKPVFHISVMLVLLVTINTSSLAMKTSSNSNASWFYSSYPFSNRALLKNGFRKFFVLYLLLPFFIITLVFFSISMKFSDALIHSLFMIAAANLFNTLRQFLSKDLPFTLPATASNMSQKFTSIIYPFGFGILVVLLQYYLYSNVLFILTGIAGLFIVNLIIIRLLILRNKQKNAVLQT